MELQAAGFGELFHTRSHLKPDPDKQNKLLYIAVLPNNTAAIIFLLEMLLHSWSGSCSPSYSVRRQRRSVTLKISVNLCGYWDPRGMSIGSLLPAAKLWCALSTIYPLYWFKIPRNRPCTQTRRNQGPYAGSSFRTQLGDFTHKGNQITYIWINLFVRILQNPLNDTSCLSETDLQVHVLNLGHRIMHKNGTDFKQ